MLGKRKKVSFATSIAPSGVATQNSFSILSTAATSSSAAPNSLPPTTTGALPPSDEPSSSAGSPPPSKKRREGSPPPAKDASSTNACTNPGKLETQIHTLAQRKANKLLAAARASVALAAAIDSAIAGLNGLAKTQGKKIAHQLNKVLRARLTPKASP